MSDSIVEAKYQIVQERSLPVIASEIHQIERNVYGVAMDGAIQIGEKLKEAQGMVPAGEWVKWLSENLNYSQRQAYNFMEIASNYGDSNSPYFNLQTSANLSISKALELLRLPDEEVENFAETHDIENESVRSLKDQISQLKKEKTEAEERAREAEQASSSVNDEEVAKLRERERELEQSVKNTLERESDLQIKLDKAKEDLKKAKAKLKEPEAAKDEEIQDRLAKASVELEEKAKADARAEAEEELQKQKELISRLTEQVEKIEAEKAKLSNTSLMEFKVMVDQLQDVYFKINDLITEQNERDPELGLKMQNALQKLIEGWRP